MRFGALSVILSLAVSVAFRASLSNTLIPTHPYPVTVIAFFVIELILDEIVIAASLKTTGRIGLKFLVVAAILVAFGILIWSKLSNAIT